MNNKTARMNIVIFVAIFIIGMAGCGNNKRENKDLETFNNTNSLKKETEKNIVEKKDLPQDSYGTIKNGIYTATQGALQMTVPDTWNVSKEDATILVAGKEDSKDCVIIHVTEKDQKFKNYKQKDFEEAYNKLFDNLEFEEFKQTKVGNLEAIYMKYTCSKDSMDIVEYQYMLNGENTYLISFTDVSGELEKEIEKCMDSIVICK
ncbi:MAG: hypothetical protein HFJ09_06130 [Lachnospiraceae bacterium]|nr:hypothetical protein [Lachnospiraceae bacterium]